MTNQGISEAVFGGSQVVNPSPRPHLPNAFHTFSLGEEWDGKAVGWELFVNDTSAGLGNVHGGIRESMALASSTLDHRFRGSIMLPSLTTTVDTTKEETQTRRLSHLNIFSSMAVSHGLIANKSLWGETSDTNPLLVAKTYTPTSSITGLHPIVIGGVSSAERLAVCRATDPIQILSDLAATPTIAGTMHGDTDNSFGLIQTPLPHPSGGFYILIYSSNAIRTLNTAAAIGDAPTSAQSNIPNGGGALGIKAPIGWPIRAWWQLPVEQNNDPLARLTGSDSSLATTNLEGTDLQRIKNPYRVLHSLAEWRDGFVMSFHRNALPHSVFYWDGQTFEDLHFATEAPKGAGLTDIRVYGIYTRGDDLFLEITKSVAVGVYTRHIEWYDPFSKRFYQVTGDADDGVAGQDTARACGSLPVSLQNGFLYTLQDYGTTNNNYWHYAFIGPSYTNPFFLLGTGGLGPSSGTAHTFEASGVATSPRLNNMEDISQFPKVVSEIVYLGGWRDTTAGSSAVIQIARQSGSLPYDLTFPSDASAVSDVVGAKFSDVDRVENNSRKFRDNTDAFIALQFRLYLARRSAGTGHTPNGLPFIIRGLAFADGKVRPPKEIYGSDWG